ncbi:uncharacterized protein LOC121388145 isoform X2 [Gigantopelta aegis]|uniref:uncharacterized protein LOC121388145 isoform X2 n=1 Tax=Gigantopelta aegis TaxID=1735272 RepID=UPI001B889214|nr:uncharacterized protein LOC121388145 isoform X2 [Gigantopelta aegis]
MGELQTGIFAQGIHHVGNYFIMDSEPLVNKPYEQLQMESASRLEKKKSTSLSEKCTSVKNNVCEKQFLMTSGQLDRDISSHLRHLYQHTSKLRHEVKVLELNKRKHEVEFKKRLEPDRDFSYDETQLSKTEKRLGVNIESFYLNKKLRYPVREKVSSDLIITPMVARARHSLQEHKKQKKVEREKERMLTAKSVTSSQGFDSDVSRVPRRGRIASKSAPLTTKNCPISRDRNKSNSRFPDIQGSSLDGGGAHSGHHGPPNKVKFAFGNPMKILTHPDSQPDFVRSHIFHGVRQYSSYTLDSSDDDSDTGLPERIDLRAILFGKSEDNQPDRDTLSVKSHPASTAPQAQIPIIRRAGSNIPQQQTQEKLRKEARHIQDKVVTFLHRLETDPLIRGKTREEFSDDEDLVEDPHSTIGYILPKSKPKPQHKAEVAEKPKEEETEPENDESEEVEREKKKINPKEAWKLIRGHTQDSSLRGAHTPADLVLQQLTGILLVGGKKGHIPLHSASRALRHTATFKMRKVVEQLIEGRTRFQQHEVNELKKQMEGEENTQAASEGSEVIETVA